MNAFWVQQNATERIETTVLDDAAVALTGLTNVLLTIRRKSDDQFWDFDDSTFKASGWTTRQGVMTEVDATNEPGTYYYSFNTNTLADDVYYMYVTCASAANVPQASELKVGGYVDYLDSSIQTVDTNVDQILIMTEYNVERSSFTYNSDGTLASAVLKFVATGSDFSSPAKTMNIAFTYDAAKRVTLMTQLEA